MTKIIHRKLGRENANGLAHLGDDIIELDIRLKGYRYLLYLIHEKCHLLHPDWSETKIVKESRSLAQFIWKNNFRKIEK